MAHHNYPTNQQTNSLQDNNYVENVPSNSFGDLQSAHYACNAINPSSHYTQLTPYSNNSSFDQQSSNGLIYNQPSTNLPSNDYFMQINNQNQTLPYSQLTTTNLFHQYQSSSIDTVIEYPTNSSQFSDNHSINAWNCYHHDSSPIESSIYPESSIESSEKAQQPSEELDSESSAQSSSEVRQKRRGRKPNPETLALAPEDRKQLQNRVAARRYREKRRMEREIIDKQLQDLLNENRAKKAEIQVLMDQFRLFREMFRESVNKKFIKP